MAPGPEAPSRSSAILAGLMGLLLMLSLLYGCRAFTPEPVIFNYPPDTFILGAPAETTGTCFRRHLYWMGTDHDGEVIRYVYAITDSTVRDPSNPYEDEENERFDPAHNIETLISTPERKVGFTTRSDSLFIFEVDRGETVSKNITFHIVAVDDRGEMDPTPARLHFVNNSLGNPQLVFSLYTAEEDGSWRLRWTGDTKGPLPVSPEDSGYPFAGYGRRFRIDWEASSPNGAILGYRYKAAQDQYSGFTPPDLSGYPQWDPGYRSFVFGNEIEAEDIEGCNVRTGEGCPPEILRWPSNDYKLRVQAIDVAKVESIAEEGELPFGVNYPPESWILKDAEHPVFLSRDESGDPVVMQFSEGDTIPDRSYAIFSFKGRDRLEGWTGASGDSFCCDLREDLEKPEVRYQGLLEMIGSEDTRIRNFQTLYSYPEVEDTLGFVVGPFAYTISGRSMDEHGRVDATADQFRFVGGFQPRILDIRPQTGDSLILRDPTAMASEGPWERNDIFHTLESVTYYWDGVQYHTVEGAGRTRVDGTIYRYQPRFEGRGDPRETGVSILSWTYSHYSASDPLNSLLDGPGDSKDLYYSVESPRPDVWEFSHEEAIQIFVPNLVWMMPELFEPVVDPPPETEAFHQTGVFLRKHLGPITLKVVGKTTNFDSEFDLYLRVRNDPATTPVAIDISRMGRRSPISTHRFHVFLGMDEEGEGEITRLWPDF